MSSTFPDQVVDKVIDTLRTWQSPTEKLVSGVRQRAEYIARNFEIRQGSAWPTAVGNKKFPHKHTRGITTHILREWKHKFGPWTVRYEHRCPNSIMGRHGGCLDVKIGIACNADLTWWIIGLGVAGITIDKDRPKVE